jgi:DNA replication protein DnaC
MTTDAKRHRTPERDDPLEERAVRLKLYGLVAHWDEHEDAPWVETLIAQEEAERQRRSLERRVRNARIGRFKPLADFDWTWPKRVDRDLVDEIFALGFVAEAANVVILGPNGTGKTTIAQNLVHEAVLKGHTARFVTASELLNDLAAQESPAALTRRLRRFCQPSLLAVDEVGYLSYDSRHADLLFEVVSRRNEQKSTVITTNRPFAEWGEVFPNASCVVALVDRLIHRAEILQIEGESFRLKEAKEREARRASERASGRARKTRRAAAAGKGR